MNCRAHFDIPLFLQNIQLDNNLFHLHFNVFTFIFIHLFSATSLHGIKQVLENEGNLQPLKLISSRRQLQLSLSNFVQPTFCTTFCRNAIFEMAQGRRIEIMQLLESTKTRKIWIYEWIFIIFKPIFSVQKSQYIYCSLSFIF